MPRATQLWLIMPILVFIGSPLWGQSNPISQSPVIDRVEPPNWWAGMKWNRVQLMISGKNLAEAEFSCPSDQLLIEEVSPSENGNYAFVNLRIPAGLSPGSYSITVKNGAGESQFEFPIFNREADVGHGR